MSTVVVGVAEAHDRLSELISQALAGVEVVIANRSEPVVRLTPIAGGQAESNGPLLAAMCQAWRQQGLATRSDDQIEAHVNEERDSWG